MSEIAKRILGDYVWNYGQSREVRIKTFNDALKSAQINCRVYTDSTGTMFFDSDDPKEMKRAINFRWSIKSPMNDNFIERMDEILESYRQRKEVLPKCLG